MVKYNSRQKREYSPQRNEILQLFNPENRFFHFSISNITIQRSITEAIQYLPIHFLEKTNKKRKKKINSCNLNSFHSSFAEFNNTPTKALFHACFPLFHFPLVESARSLKDQLQLVEKTAFIRALCLRNIFANQLDIFSSPKLVDRYEKGGNSFIRFAVLFVSNIIKVQ